MSASSASGTAPQSAASSPAEGEFAAEPVLQASGETERPGRLWGWPIALGVLTATGLVSALVSEGWGDVWSWIALGVPVAVMAWFGLLRRRG
ncbi:hypothetical protein [Acidovorax sp. PRC11]|uniref:hypothetical protein n=1 Tax=Acidovorax sp. PRC11 TaxID=2962592 RepID=UPI002881B427|nr:hypothetical protein [Acidovorax sp. PRC11]MDT0137810.1 hypothetical protein [Acidovorax sp. PRC11]